MNAESKLRIAIIQENIAKKLDEIKEYFEPHCKLTFIMRNPELEDNTDNMIITNDALEELIKVLETEIENSNKKKKEWFFYEDQSGCPVYDLEEYKKGNIHLNFLVPIKKWDYASYQILGRIQRIKKSIDIDYKGGTSISDGVCTLKHAFFIKINEILTK